MILTLLLLAQQSPGAELDAQIDELQRRASARYVITSSVADRFEAIQAECPAEAWSCPVSIAPGRYGVDRPIVLTRRVDVDAYGAELVFNETHGVIMAREADGSTWRGGRIFATTSTSARTMGVAVRGGLQSLVDVRVQGFTHGVDIVCGDGQPSEHAAMGFEYIDGHCNIWHLDRVTASSNLLSGVYVQGADANAGSAVGVNSFVNCKKASQMLPLPNYEQPENGGRCANFWDQSFLGNTWVASHSAHAVDNDGVRWFQYLSTSSNGRTVWVGTYAENGAADGQSGNGPSVLSGYGHHVYGGLNNIQVDSDGFRIREGGQINQARFNSDELNGHSSQILLGESAGLGSPFVINPSTGGQIRLMPIGLDGDWWELEVGRASNEWVGRVYLGEDRDRWGLWRENLRTLLPACTSTTGVTWSSPSGLVVRSDQEGMSICDSTQ